MARRVESKAAEQKDGPKPPPAGRKAARKAERAEVLKRPGKRTATGRRLLSVKRTSARHRGPDPAGSDQLEAAAEAGAELAELADVDDDLVVPVPEVTEVQGGARHIEVSYEGPGGDRVDAWTARATDLSREAVVRLLGDGHITVDDTPVRKNHRLVPGEQVVVDVPPPRPIDCVAEPIPLQVMYEDAQLLVLVKPRGMLTHPVGRHTTGTLVNALLAHCKNLSGIGGHLRPGIVHRLDRETSGLMVVAKSDKAHRALSDQFRGRTIEKLYLAVVHGHLEHPEGRIEAPIGRDPRAHDRRRVDPQRGKPAVSEYRARSEHGRLTLVEVRLLTGRTHQIRLHLAFLKHPIVGDHLYGRREDARMFRGVALHSHRLAFSHPVSGARLSFESPLPADIEALLAAQPALARRR